MARVVKSCWQVAVISPVHRSGDTVQCRTSRVMHSIPIHCLPPQCKRFRSSRLVSRPKWSWPPKSRSRRRRPGLTGLSRRAAVKPRFRGSAEIGERRSSAYYIGSHRARVSIETSEFENGRTKSHVQTAVHASLLHVAWSCVTSRRCDGIDLVTTAVKLERRSMWNVRRLFCCVRYRYQTTTN